MSEGQKRMNFTIKYYITLLIHKQMITILCKHLENESSFSPTPVVPTDVRGLDKILKQYTL